MGFWDDIGDAVGDVADMVVDTVGDMTQDVAEIVKEIPIVGDVVEAAAPFAGIAGTFFGGPIGGMVGGAVSDALSGGNPFDAIGSTIGLLSGGDLGGAASALLGGDLGGAMSMLGGSDLMGAAGALLGGTDFGAVIDNFVPDGLAGLSDLAGLGDLSGLGGAATALFGGADIGSVAGQLLGGGSLLDNFESALGGIAGGALGDLGGGALGSLLGEGGPQAVLNQALDSIGLPSNVLDVMSEATGFDSFGDLGGLAGLAGGGAFANALEALGVPSNVLDTAAQVVGAAAGGAPDFTAIGSALSGLAANPGALDSVGGADTQAFLGSLHQAGGLEQTLDRMDADDLRALLIKTVADDAPVGSAGEAVRADDDMLGVAGVTASVRADTESAGVANAADPIGTAPGPGDSSAVGATDDFASTGASTFDASAGGTGDAGTMPDATGVQPPQDDAQESDFAEAIESADAVEDAFDSMFEDGAG